MRCVLITPNKIPAWVRVLKSLPKAVRGKQVSFSIYSELELILLGKSEK